jgi:hypothetical protein
MLPRVALLGLLVGACTSSEPPPRVASTPPTTRASTAVAMPTSSSDVPPTAPDAAPVVGDVFEGTIVGEGPIGDGACVQKSYEIEPKAGARLWIHFERCGAAGPSPAAGGLEGLDVGSTFRFTVRRGASKNFGEGAILFAAEKL